MEGMGMKTVARKRPWVRSAPSTRETPGWEIGSRHVIQVTYILTRRKGKREK